MNKFTKRFISKSIDVGKIILDPEKHKLLFDTHIKNNNGTIKRKYFVELGDVVYTFIHNGMLHKFGKAAGAAGWYDRATQYKQHGDKMDKTSEKIINYMKKNKIQEFIVYAFKSPPTITSILCPITNDVVSMKVETAHTLEQRLIQLAYSAGEKLPLCQEVKK
jgi:hypothetical protein